MHFHYMTHMATPQHKNPCPGGHEIYNFGGPFRGHHYYILSLSNLCLGVEKKIFKEIMHFHYMTYMATPQHKNPCPGGHEIYNFGRPFLCHHNYILSLSDLCLGVEKTIFKEMMHSHYKTCIAIRFNVCSVLTNIFALHLKQYTGSVHICINCAYLLQIHVAQGRYSHRKAIIQ